MHPYNELEHMEGHILRQLDELNNLNTHLHESLLHDANQDVAFA